MTDWDNLEGEALNLALAVAAERVVGGESPRELIPDYANSIDAQKRDLEPLLPQPSPNMLWCWVEYRDHTYFHTGGESADMHQAEGPPTLARARCLGKALEARQ